jgi:hypothetical protein
MDVAHECVPERLVHIDNERIAVPALIRDVLAPLKTRAHEKQLDVALDLPEEAVWYTDAAALRSIVTNLVTNAIDYSPPVDITFGDFLRALLTADLDLHAIDPDGVRDALMQAFRLRGIVPEGAKFFSEESLCWPKVERNEFKVNGLVFGDPNGLTRSEKNINGDILRNYAKQHARALGFDPNLGPIDAPSFHPMFHVGQDGSLYVNMIVELVQTIRVPLSDHSDTSSTFPMRNGVTLLISQDPPKAGLRPEPRIRFVTI